MEGKNNMGIDNRDVKTVDQDTRYNLQMPQYYPDPYGGGYGGGYGGRNYGNAYPGNC